MPKKDMFGMKGMGNFNMPDLNFDSGSNSGFNMDLDLGMNLGGSMESFGGKSKSARKEKPVDWKKKGEQAKEVGTRIVGGYKTLYYNLKDKIRERREHGRRHNSHRRHRR